MAQKPNISFIPKQSLAKENGQQKRPVSLLMIISVGLLVISAGVYGGLYFYADSIAEENANKEAQLTEVRGELDRSILKEAQAMEARLKGAEAVVNNHLALTSVFGFLSSYTLTDVQLNSFVFERTEEGELTVSIEGRGPDFASIIALRRSFLGEGDVLKDGKLTNVGLGDRGEVNFAFSGTIAEEAIRYEQPAESVSVGERETPGNENEVGTTTVSTSTTEQSSD